MPIVFGFAQHRRQQLEAEYLRLAGAMHQLGAERFWLAGDLAAGTVGPTSELVLVIVKEMDEPFQRRSDFFQTHLRPQVGTSFAVYTPAEFAQLRETDPVLLAAQRLGEEVVV